MKAFRHLGNAQMVFGAAVQVNNLINYLPGRGPLLVVTGRHLAGSVTWKKSGKSPPGRGNRVHAGKPSMGNPHRR